MICKGRFDRFVLNHLKILPQNYDFLFLFPKEFYLFLNILKTFLSFSFCVRTQEDDEKRNTPFM